MVLVAPRNPLNIGAAARAISNFGFTELVLVNPYQVAFREARSAVNAGPILESACEAATVAEAIRDATLVVGATGTAHRELEHTLCRLEQGARVIRRHLAAGPAHRVALLFGSEKYGLSNDDMSHCHLLIRIPTREAHESMNLGQAVAVCLYELIRSPGAARRMPEARRPANAEQTELFLELLYKLLAVSGYVNPRTADSTHRKLRRLVHRLSLNARDAFVWLGILRQALWKAGQSECYPHNEMTKVALQFALARPLADSDLESVGKVHGVYGIHHVKALPGMEAIDVEYDASRLSVKDVERALWRCGLPVKRGE